MPGPIQSRGGRSAFTLLEVLVTLALILLLTGIVIGASVSLLRDRPVTGEEVVKYAIAQARRYAVENFREVRLSFDAKEKAFIASTEDGTRTFPVEFPGELQIEFLSAQKGGSVLLGGDLVETARMPYVTFYPDGACSAFRAQLRTGGPARVLAIDPWTCAPMLEAKQP